MYYLNIKLTIHQSSQDTKYEGEKISMNKEVAEFFFTLLMRVWRGLKKIKLMENMMTEI